MTTTVAVITTAITINAGWLFLYILTFRHFLKRQQKRKCECGHRRAFHKVRDSGYVGSCQARYRRIVPSTYHTWVKVQTCECQRYDGPDAYIVPMQ